jgi:MerR family transcriptional regulator, light-induced transcriptional regulator
MTNPSAPNEPTPSLTIADIERETGLGKDALRVWERRYGFPSPVRDALGERRYGTDQLHRLRQIKRLLDAGRRPGQVVALDGPALEAMTQALGTETAATRRRNRTPTVPVPDPQWMLWLRQNRADEFRQALQQHLIRDGLARGVEDLVAPLCVQVGDGWMRGELSVFQEHLFTELVQSVLRESMAALDASHRGHLGPPRILLTTIPNEQHALGLLMAECALALEGCQRVSLGASTPLVEIVDAARQLSVDVVALSFSAHCPRRDVFDSLAQLRRQLPSTVALWVGGNAPTLRHKTLAGQVTVARQAGDLARLVQDWRAQHPAR